MSGLEDVATLCMNFCQIQYCFFSNEIVVHGYSIELDPIPSKFNSKKKNPSRTRYIILAKTRCCSKDVMKYEV